MRTCGRWALLVLFTFVAILMNLGCGTSNLSKVEGIVTLDGKPLSGATVSFIPVKKEGKPAFGQTDKDGSFRLTTFRTNDGAQPGEYQVVVVVEKANEEFVGRDPQTFTDEEKKAMRMGTMSPSGKRQVAENKKKQVSPVPAIYSDVKQTPLKEVVPTSGKIELALRTDVR
jgi:outer membrane usher protein FimD/PapC